MTPDGRSTRRWLPRLRPRTLAAVLTIGLVTVTGCSTASSTAASSSAASSASAPASTAPKTVTNVTLAESVQNITDLPVWVAEKEGYFAQQGLNVKVVVLSTASVTPAVIAGSAQFIKDPGFTFVTARSKGAAIEAVSKLDTGLPFALIVGKAFAAAHGITASTPLKQDLQAIASSPGGSTAAGQVGATRVLYQSFGIRPPGAGATFASVPAMVTALSQGEIDWFVAAQPVPAQAQSRGGGIVVTDSTNAPAWNVQPADFVLATATSYANSHPAVTKKMVTAVDQGLRFISAHKQHAAAIAQANESGVSMADILAAIAPLRWPTSGSMSTAFWTSSLSYFARAGILPKGATVKTLAWTNRFVSLAGS